MICPKPQTLEEVERLMNDGEIEVWIAEESDKGLHLLICDRRRTVEEGELYEIVVGKPSCL